MNEPVLFLDGTRYCFNGPGTTREPARAERCPTPSPFLKER